jgi:hypothetical protein
LDRLIFGLLLATAAVFGVAMLLPEPLTGHGIEHPQLPSMFTGGPSEYRTGAALWVGWGFGALQILLFGALMAFGARRRSVPMGMALPLVLAVTLYLLTFTAMVVVYSVGVGGSDRSLFLGLPPATAVLAYGLWPLGGSFTLLFVFGFRRWVLSDRELARYEQLLAGRRQSGLEDDPNADGAPARGAER